MTQSKPYCTMSKSKMKIFGGELMAYIADKTGEEVMPVESHPALRRDAYSTVEFSNSKWNLWFMKWEGQGKDFYLILFKEAKYVLELDMRRIQVDGDMYKWVLGHHRTFADVIAQKYARVEAKTDLGETRFDSGYLLCDGVGKSEVMDAFIDLLGTVMGTGKEVYDIDSREAVEGYARDRKSVDYSRDPSLPKKCKERDDYTCRACDSKICINGQYIIEAHHTNPLPNGIRTTTLDDLVSLCPNCHRIAHLREHPYSVDEIRKLRNA